MPAVAVSSDSYHQETRHMYEKYSDQLVEKPDFVPKRLNASCLHCGRFISDFFAGGKSHW